MEKRPEMYYFSIKVNKKWIQDYVDRETALPRNQIVDTENAIKQEQEDLKTTEKARLKTRQQLKQVVQRFNAIENSMGNIAY
jgi:hypothetical protein